MIKFLFSRMTEPDAGPSWAGEGAPWEQADPTAAADPQEPIWRAQGEAEG
jgi:hypothetical protein